MSYSLEELSALQKFYENQLLNDTLPFWFPSSLDKEFGGFLFMKDEDGSLIDDDKAVWIQGRATWLLHQSYYLWYWFVIGAIAGIKKSWSQTNSIESTVSKSQPH